MPKYDWLKGKKTLFSAIKNSAKLSSEIYIASDPDREGEMIAEHISQELSGVKGKKFRIRLKEISKSELHLALKSPTTIDQKLVDSQIARRLIDRIFGFEISPELWKALKSSNLSAGRVQSTVLRWICERELEIRNFTPEIYVSLKVVVSYASLLVELSYFLEKDEDHINAEKAFMILRKYGVTKPGKSPPGISLKCIDIKEKEYKHFPPPAFTTASMQETSARVLGYSSTQTMRIAQGLYEGKKVKGEITGLITYMRTDSTRVSPAKLQKGQQFISKYFPYLKLGKPKVSRAKLHSQDAHEAIVPTDPFLSPDDCHSFLKSDELKIYQLIWNRFMASILEAETGLERAYTFEGEGERWICKWKEGISLGYKNWKGNELLPMDPLKGLKKNGTVGCEDWIWEDKTTSPKERFTEGSIIAKMEKTGIGRPSTYAQILITLLKRKYIFEVKKKLASSQIGERVNNHLVEKFGEMISEQFTKDMEDSLDELANGKGTKLTLIRNFYERVQNLKKNSRSTQKVKTESREDARAEVSSSEPKIPNKPVIKMVFKTCPICDQGQVRTKMGKNGKTIFFCSRFPHCDYVSYEPI